jgi:hypothetical protein
MSITSLSRHLFTRALRAGLGACLLAAPLLAGCFLFEKSEEQPPPVATQPAATPDAAAPAAAPAAPATPPVPEKPELRFLEVKGKVMVNGKPAAAELALNKGDKIEIGPKSTAVITVGPDNVIEIREQGKFEVAAGERHKVAIKLTAGKLWAVGGGADFEVDTEDAVVSGRGTAFVDVSKKGTVMVDACSGLVHMTELGGGKFDKDIDARQGDHRVVTFVKKGKKLTVKEGQPAKAKGHTDAELQGLMKLIPHPVGK